MVKLLADFHICNGNNGTDPKDSDQEVKDIAARFSYSRGQTTYCLTTFQQTEETDAEEVTDILPKDAVILRDYFQDFSITKPKAGESPQTDIKETDYYTGTIEWDCMEPVFQAGKVYTAKVILKAKSGFYFEKSAVPVIVGAQCQYEITPEDSAENQLTITIVFPETADMQDENKKDNSQKPAFPDQDQNDNMKDDSQKPAFPDQDQNDNMKNDNREPLFPDQNGNNDSAGNGIQMQSPASYGGGDYYVQAGGIAADNTGAGKTSLSQNYGYYEAVAVTVQLQDKASIAINVDETDILSIEKGQEATITFDAIAEKEYTGTITRIADNASNNSGSPKYTVEISLTKDEKIKNGMSASATIITGQVEDAITIPVNALQETAGKKFVYTKEEKDGTLSGETEVKTGLSDGTNVQIISGLKENDTVYYIRTESSLDSLFEFDEPGGSDEPEM